MIDLSDKGSDFKSPIKVQGSAEKHDTSAPDKMPEVGLLYRNFRGGLVVTKEILTIEPTGLPGISYYSLDNEWRLYSTSCSDFLNKINNTDQTKYTLVNIPTSTELIKKYIQPIVGESILEELLTMHDMKYRKYHRSWLIEWILVQVQELKLELSKTQLLALIFHNVIYVPGVGQNELICAQLFKKFAPDFPCKLSPAEEQHVVQLLQDMGTRKNNTTESGLLLDLLMLPLAATGVELCAWEELIWLENKHLMDRENARKDFDTRRLKYVLSLAKEKLFTHLTQFEPTVRVNLEGLRQAWVKRYNNSKA